MLQPPRRYGMSFSAYSADTEDYTAYLSSDESISDVEDASVTLVDAKSGETMDELTSEFASSNYLDSSSYARKVLTPICSLSGGQSSQKVADNARKEVQTLATGAFVLGGGKEVKVSPRVLELHNSRRMQLQDALDGARDSTTITEYIESDAPFRFVTQHKSTGTSPDVMGIASASPTPVNERVGGHAPEKKHWGRRRPAGMTEKGDVGEYQKEFVDRDPLFDEQLDDADELWVQTNLRGTRATNQESDATLCCPCCFVTVCMVCERHATFTTQYRATAAINCRVKTDNILTLTSRDVPASLPFHKRQHSFASNTSMTCKQQIAQLLQENEFYAVVCSDCRTMVGVFDRNQQYHFFNALPAN